MGAENFLLSSTMNAIVGQRIVRTICPHCRVAFTPPAPVLEQMKTVLGNLFPVKSPNVQFYQGKGCSECGDSGYLGRVGIFEVLPISAKIASLVLERQDSAAIQKEAVAEGMITMMQDGFLKVLAGITTPEEVLRVAQE